MRHNYIHIHCFAASASRIFLDAGGLFPLSSTAQPKRGFVRLKRVRSEKDDYEELEDSGGGPASNQLSRLTLPLKAGETVWEVQLW